MTAADWDRRIARAAELEADYPAAAEMLRFYGAVAAFQKQVFLRAPADFAELAVFVADFERIAQRVGPYSFSAEHLTAVWGGAGLEPVATFFARALLEPYAARLGACPWCECAPQAALLRAEGYGAKRSLVCGLCSSERPFARLECPACGEREFDKLPVYTAAEFPHIRVDACQSCRRYLKTIDLTKNGLADAVVDEMASAPLDLWAGEQGYTKMQVNLLGL